FEFTVLNYGSSEKSHYRYMLEGYQKEWVDAGNERKAFYTNLNPGIYIFKVTATNQDGMWNPKPVELTIIINSPYWDTAWFKMLAALTFSMLVGIFIRIRIRS